MKCRSGTPLTREELEEPIWERQQRETPSAFAAFCVYRDMGLTRTLRKAAKEYYENKGRKYTNAKQRQFQEWSAKYLWTLRSVAYDNELDRQRRLENREAINEMAERHAKVAIHMQSKAMSRLRDLNPEEMSVSELRNFLKDAVEIERKSRGEPSEIISEIMDSHSKASSGAEWVDEIPDEEDEDDDDE